MSLPPIYSRRNRQAAGTQSDIYDYGPFPQKLRTQIAQIAVDAIGQYAIFSHQDQKSNAVWEHILRLMRREVGVNKLVPAKTPHDQAELLSWMQMVPDVETYLDALELIFGVVDNFVRDTPAFQNRTISTPDDAIAELNARMLEAGVGYQYKSDEIIRVDSLILHTDVVLPAISLTSVSGFVSANDEYLKAHKAYRDCDYETCITECAKAFESTLKVIGTERKWNIQPNDTASKLIDAGVQAGFIQGYVAAGFNSLRGMLESGVAPVRNKNAAHGAGVAPRQVPQELAAFQLHQTGAVIVFLIESHQAQP